MPKPEVNAVTLVGELSEHLGKISPLSAVAEGEESRAFGFESNNERFIVRINHTAIGFHKEAYIQQRFSNKKLPIPENVLIQPFADGLHLCVSRRAKGHNLQELSQRQLRDTLGSVSVLLDAMTQADVSQTTGYGMFDTEGVGPDRSWRQFLLHVTDSARFNWDDTQIELDFDLVGPLIDLVCNFAPNCPEIRHLVHADFGANNIIAQGDKVTGLIDWSGAMFGDPLYDVANILYWRPWLYCMEQQAQFFEQHQPGRLKHAKRLQIYQVRIGLSHIYWYACDGDHRMVDWSMSRTRSIAKTLS